MNVNIYIIKEVFILNEEMDEMNMNEIGFKVNIDGEIVEIIQDMFDYHETKEESIYMKHFK